MRAPFQILAIPYRLVDNRTEYCVFHRADLDQWQFIAGGGENAETPWEAAKRETLEEGGVRSEHWIALDSLAYVPAMVISEKHRQHWSRDIYVIPEDAFGFECTAEIELSEEHTECVWLSYEEASGKLQWDSNRTALFELNCILTQK